MGAHGATFGRLLAYGDRVDKRQRARGQWDTISSPFDHPPAKTWLEEVARLGLAVVEPFCGAGNLVRMLPNVNWQGLYDIELRTTFGLAIEQRDTIADFPRQIDGSKYGAVITNPPWLSRRSARMRAICIEGGAYDDLYKEALAVCLAHVAYVAAIVPESFATSGLFLDRLQAIVSLPYDVFGGLTEHPACLALFAPADGRNVSIWRGDLYIGTLAELRRHPIWMLRESDIAKVRFYRPQGTIALYGMDSRTGPSIRFSAGDEVEPGRVKRSSRHVQRLDLDIELPQEQILRVVKTANAILEEFRRTTCDVTLTAARARRKDGSFRRRLDFDTAARILTLALKAEGIHPSRA